MQFFLREFPVKQQTCTSSQSIMSITLLYSEVLIPPTAGSTREKKITKLGRPWRGSWM
jgi:hypothetical protein